jgi:hypothetical protein
VPEAGLYLVFVQSRTAGVAFRQLPYLTLNASGAGAADAAKTSAQGQ